VPVQRLLDPEYLEQRARQIALDRSLPAPVSPVNRRWPGAPLPFALRRLDRPRFGRNGQPPKAAIRDSSARGVGSC